MAAVEFRFVLVDPSNPGPSQGGTPGAPPAPPSSWGFPPWWGPGGAGGAGAGGAGGPPTPNPPPGGAGTGGPSPVSSQRFARLIREREERLDREDEQEFDRALAHKQKQARLVREREEALDRQDQLQYERAQKQAESEKAREDKKSETTQRREQAALGGIVARVAGVEPAGILAARQEFAGAGTGPLGKANAVLAIVDMAAGMMARGFDTARAKVQDFGEATVMAIDNQHLGLFAKGVASAANSLEQIPIVGKAFAAELRFAAEPVVQFASVVKALVERGKALEDYSADIAIARANAEVNSVFADIREAGRLGPQLARVIELENEIDIRLREFMLPIKESLLNMVVPILEKIAGYLEVLPDALKSLGSLEEKIPGWVIAALTAFAPDKAGLLATLKGALLAIKKIGEMLEARDVEVDAMKGWDWLFTPPAVRPDGMHTPDGFRPPLIGGW
jgi:hypothetical protein